MACRYCAPASKEFGEAYAKRVLKGATDKVASMLKLSWFGENDDQKSTLLRENLAISIALAVMEIEETAAKLD
jgi:hypothetical protein